MPRPLRGEATRSGPATLRHCVIGEDRSTADKTNLFSIAVQAAGASQYRNVVVAALNDHVLRLSVMTEPYGLHSHPDSDEIFVGIDRTALIEFDDSSVELVPADLVTVPKGVIHKTRPLGDRSVNLKIEPANLETRWVEI